jgi:hypothetical protein
MVWDWDYLYFGRLVEIVQLSIANYIEVTPLDYI